MALTNAQYQIVMREYEEQQLRNRRAQRERIEEVYAALPRVRELDREISARGADAARRTLAGDRGAAAQLKEELAAIRREKQELLAAAGYPADYTELRYRCPDCKDTGYADGKRCRCFEQARIRILYDQSNISGLLERENFETLSFRYYDENRLIPGLNMTERDYMRSVVNRCRSFAEHFPEKDRNIIFTGSTGVGKTFLTNCIAKALIDRYVSVIYLTSQDLFDILSKFKFSRDPEEDEAEVYQHIMDCDMLIIDDLGTEVNNTFVTSQLFYCIDRRISTGKGTVISTNLSMDMLRDLYSDRVMSRLRSNYISIPLYGADIRMKKRQSRYEST